jgi:fatty acid omega-hydroxylase
MSRDYPSVAWADIEARKSFVGLFVEDAQRRGEPLSEDFLRDLVLNFLIAGRDTTAQALSWAIYLICAHPEVEATARQEISDVCGVRGPVYEDMNRLRYLQAVISEALRLYPSVPNDIKTTLRDDTLPDGTFVPAGTLVVYDICSMGRDAATWGSDAQTFRPERWLEMSEAPGMYHYPVFNAGPRECLGRRLAMVEMKMCLATLLPQLSFRLAVPADEVTVDAQMTIGMGRGLPCFVVRATEKERANSSASTGADSEGPTSIGGESRGRGDSAADLDGECA